MPRAWDAMIARVNAARRRFAGVDHFFQAVQRYDEVLGGRLAAAIAYYGYFALFALALIGFAGFGLLLRYNVDLDDQVQRFLRENLPFLDVAAIQQTGRAVGAVGALGLVLTGVAWVEAIRSSQRLIWRLDQQPGNPIIRRLVDLAVLVAVLLMVAVSVGAVYAFEALLDRLTGRGAAPLLTLVSWLLTIAVNMLLATALLVAVPRIRMSARRLVSPVLLVGIGITLLNTVGRVLVGYVKGNPAYALVASAVGLLVYLYLFNLMLLFGAAWAATSRHGRVTDLSGTEPAERPSSAQAGPAGRNDPSVRSGPP